MAISKRPGLGGRVTTDGNNLPWGNALYSTDVNAARHRGFSESTGTFPRATATIIELEGALRAQAELDAINQKLYAVTEEDIPMNIAIWSKSTTVYCQKPGV